MRISIRMLSAGVALVALLPLGVAAQRGGFGFGGPMQQERKVLAQFDKNGDKRLDATERKAAREWLATQPAGGFGGRRGGPFRQRRAAPNQARKLTPADVKSYPTAPVYDPATIRTVFLQFEETDWEQELAAFNNTDVDVPAAATIDGKVYKDVGVHFRGMSSYFMVPEGRKRSLNLSFDFADEKQQLGGYKTLNLLNAAGDPSFLRAVLYTRDRVPLHADAEDELHARRHQRRELGALRERAAVQQGLHTRLLQIDEGCAMEGSGQPRRSGRIQLPRRRPRDVQANVRDDEQGRSEGLG